MNNAGLFSVSLQLLIPGIFSVLFIFFVLFVLNIFLIWKRVIKKNKKKIIEFKSKLEESLNEK